MDNSWSLWNTYEHSYTKKEHPKYDLKFYKLWVNNDKKYVVHKITILCWLLHNKLEKFFTNKK